ncbi:MAG: hypothetical protein IJN64_08985 [Lachnospiraceae bacterium]|nr:hypothetical protein [Lachnospiraceae bacterium]
MARDGKNCVIVVIEFAIKRMGIRKSLPQLMEMPVMKDLKSFFDEIIDVNVGQTIIAITIKDSDTEQAIAALDPDTYNLIRIEKRAFVKMSEEMI